MVARTYVIQDIRNEELTVMPAVRKLPFYLLGGLFLITLASTIYDLNSNSDFYDSSKLSKLNLVHENILKQDNISDASVFMNFEPLIDSTGTKSFIYTIEIQTNKSIENKANIEDNISNPELKQTVETFIKSKVYETDNDILDVVVNSGFDIGIASQTNSFTIGKSIYKWKEAYRL